MPRGPGARRARRPFKRCIDMFFFTSVVLASRQTVTVTGVWRQVRRVASRMIIIVWVLELQGTEPPEAEALLD